MEDKEKRGSFVIRIGKMGVIASHLIIVKGISENRWYEPFLMDFIRRKVETEIDDFWQTEIELLDIRNTELRTEIEIAVYISGVGSSETIKEYTREWLENHIKGFSITNLQVKAVSSLARISDGE